MPEKLPPLGKRMAEGLKPYRPQLPQGLRIEPPMSEPML
jgi:hypothetical protein